MSIKTPIQTLVNEYADPALAVYARSPQQLQRVEGANIVIQQVTENITQVVTQVTQVYPVASNVAAGVNKDVQFNSDDKLSADQADEFTYNQVTNTLFVAGNVTTGNIRTDNLLRSNGDPWTFVTYTNVNASSYLSVFDGNISANVFSGNGALLTNIANTSIVGNVAMATEAELSNVANIAYRVDAGNVIGKVHSANLADDAVRIAAANIDGIVAIANIAHHIDAANIAGVVAEADLSNIANIAYNVDAGNITGKVAAASIADNAGNVTNAVQANILAVGDLRFLNVVAPDPMLGVAGDGNINANNITLLANITADYALANVFWANVKDTPSTLTAYGITSGDALLYSDEKAQTWIATNESNVKGNVITANTFAGEGGNISNIAWTNITGKPSDLTDSGLYVSKTTFDAAIAQIYNLLTDGGSATGITSIDGGTSSSTFTTTIDGGTA
jgi:HAMP domain-containing protein